MQGTLWEAHCTLCKAHSVWREARETTNNRAIEAMFRFTLWHRQKEERMKRYSTSTSVF